jgi:hypothetical protein
MTDVRIARLEAVSDERDRQIAKWGPQTHPDGTGQKYAWEAEVAKQFADQHAQYGDLSWADILKEEFYEALAESDTDRLTEELIQVAAVAVAWLEDLATRD